MLMSTWYIDPSPPTPPPHHNRFRWIVVRWTLIYYHGGDLHKTRTERIKHVRTYIRFFSRAMNRHFDVSSRSCTIADARPRTVYLFILLIRVYYIIPPFVLHYIMYIPTFPASPLVNTAAATGEILLYIIKRRYAANH